MFITHSLYFYAAHRVFGINEKCESLHGHTYYINFTCRTEMSGDYSTPFHKFDEITNAIKETFDHCTMIAETDVELLSIADKLGKHIVLPVSTTVENLASIFFEFILQLGFDISEVSVQETTKNVVKYTREDYDNVSEQAKAARKEFVGHLLS